MEKKENQRVVVTKRMLLESLLELLKRKQLNEISVTELCKRAGINRATFYKHYSTPNDILLEISQNLTSQLLQIQSDARNLEDVFERSCLFIHEHADIVRVLVHCRMDSSIATSAFRVLGDSKHASYFQNREDFDETDRRLWITFIGSGCYNMLKCWLTDDIDKTPQEIATLLFQMCTKGWMLS